LLLPYPFWQIFATQSFFPDLAFSSLLLLFFLFFLREQRCVYDLYLSGFSLFLPIKSFFPFFSFLFLLFDFPFLSSLLDEPDQPLTFTLPLFSFQFRPSLFFFFPCTFCVRVKLGCFDSVRFFSSIPFLIIPPFFLPP